MSERIVQDQAENCSNLFTYIADEVIDYLEGTLLAVGQDVLPSSEGLRSREHENALRFLDLNQRCLNLIAIADSQPGDLQKVGLIMRAAMELEQVNDLISRIIDLRAGIGQELIDSFGFNSIGNLTILLGIRSLDAFITNEAKAFNDILVIECELEDMHRQVRENAMILMQTSLYSLGEVLASRSLSWHLERIASHLSDISKCSTMALSDAFSTGVVGIGPIPQMTGFSKN